MAKKVKSKKTASLKKVGKNADTPATHGQLDAVRSELKSEITTLSLKMDSGFKQVDSRFKKVDAKFDQEMQSLIRFTQRFKKCSLQFNR